MNNYEMYITDYLSYLKTKNYSPETIRVRQNILKQLTYFFEEKKVTDINCMDTKTVQEFIVFLQTYFHRHRRVKKKKISSNYLREKLFKFKAFFHYLLERNKIVFNPFEKIEMPLPEFRLPRNILTESEIHTLLEMPDVSTDTGRRDRAMLELAYSSGLRRKEIVDLQLTDLDLKNGQAFIRQGKPKKDRVVPVGGSACKYIRLYLEQTRQYVLLDSRITHVFLTQNGQPLKIHSMYGTLKKYIRELGFKKRTGWHTIRHTFATHLLQNGADIRYIKELLGHASVETTQLYTRVHPEEVITEVKKYHPCQKKKRKNN